MKLSEAIRLGAMLKPQIRGRSFDGRGTCAAAAACDAIGRLERWKDVWEIVRERWPIIDATGTLPVHVFGAEYKCSVETGIIYLNDSGEHWTREQIADWVESIERAHETVIENGNQAAEYSAVPVPSEAP